MLGLLWLEAHAIAQRSEDEASCLRARLRLERQRGTLELVAEVAGQVYLSLRREEGPTASFIADEESDCRCLDFWLTIFDEKCADEGRAIRWKPRRLLVLPEPAAANLDRGQAHWLLVTALHLEAHICVLLAHKAHLLSDEVCVEFHAFLRYALEEF